MQACALPEPASFTGGPWPHSHLVAMQTLSEPTQVEGGEAILPLGLHAAYSLNGNFTNSFGPLDNLTEQSAWEEQLGTGETKTLWFQSLKVSVQ